MAKLDEQNEKAKKNVNKKQSEETESDLRGRTVVYIDNDDDITAVISKIKDQHDSVIALVPPKRVGVLQSVVNLKLLQRSAKMAHKQLVIVTVDSALINLAASVGVAVAKNINAQAKVPDMVDNELDDEVINGLDIEAPQPKAASRAKSLANKEDKEISAAVAAIETDDRIHNDHDADGVPDDIAPKVSPVKKQRTNVAVPSIDKLRKKLIIGGGVAVALISFLVWAIIFAPRATIVVKAKTKPVDITGNLSLVSSSDTDIKQDILPPVVKQKKVNETVQFNVTGSKEVGEKAHGTVSFCYANTPMDGFGGENVLFIPAGTRLYAGGAQFVTDADIAVKGGFTRHNMQCNANANYHSVKATAVNIGSEGNISSGTAFKTAGFDVVAVAKGDFKGGSRETIKIAQQSDVDKAIDQIKQKVNAEGVLKELKDKMASSTLIIDKSFTVKESQPKVTPAIGERTDGKASVSIEITYTLVGVNKDNLNDLLSAKAKQKINPSKQKVYSTGIDQITFSDFKILDNGYSVSIATKGQIGPTINEADIKKFAVNKKAEVIKAEINRLSGVSDVQIQMTPFWVNSVSTEDKIKINFALDK